MFHLSKEKMERNQCAQTIYILTLICEMQFSLWVAMRKICKGLVTVLPSFSRVRRFP